MDFGPHCSLQIFRSLYSDLKSKINTIFILHPRHLVSYLVYGRVSSKQTKINFGSNRNKPKQDMFRVCFGLFRETKNKKFRFVSVCFDLFRCFEPISKQRKQTNLFRNKLKQPKIFRKIPEYTLFQTV